MIVHDALVIRVDTHGSVEQRDTQAVALLMVDAVRAGDAGTERHLVVVLGDVALSVEAGALQRVLWLGRRERVEGALLAGGVDGLRVVDAAVIDVQQQSDAAEESAATLRVTGGRYSIELPLSAVLDAVREPCAPHRFAASPRMVH